jgi:enoyl-CoA hydratase
VGGSTGLLMFFTGRRLPAAELYRQGAISAVVAREQLMAEAMSIAREIASKSPTGIRYAKRSYNTTALMPQRDGYRFEQTATHALSFTEDAQEAQAAFREKRRPVFKGR